MSKPYKFAGPIAQSVSDLTHFSLCRRFQFVIERAGRSWAEGRISRRVVDYPERLFLPSDAPGSIFSYLCSFGGPSSKKIMVFETSPKHQKLEDKSNLAGPCCHAPRRQLDFTLIWGPMMGKQRAGCTQAPTLRNSYISFGS